VVVFIGYIEIVLQCGKNFSLFPGVMGKKFQNRSCLLAPAAARNEQQPSLKRVE